MFSDLYFLVIFQNKSIHSIIMEIFESIKERFERVLYPSHSTQKHSFNVRNLNAFFLTWVILNKKFIE